MTLTLFQNRQSRAETLTCSYPILSSVGAELGLPKLADRSKPNLLVAMGLAQTAWVLQSLITAITCCFPLQRWASCLWIGFLPWLKSVARNPRIRSAVFHHRIFCYADVWHVLAALRCATRSHGLVH